MLILFKTSKKELQIAIDRRHFLLNMIRIHSFTTKLLNTLISLLTVVPKANKFNGFPNFISAI